MKFLQQSYSKMFCRNIFNHAESYFGTYIFGNLFVSKENLIHDTTDDTVIANR